MKFIFATSFAFFVLVAVQSALVEAQGTVVIDTPVCQTPGSDTTQHCVYGDWDLITWGPTQGEVTCSASSNDDFGTVQGKGICQVYDGQSITFKCSSDGTKSATVTFDHSYSRIDSVVGPMSYYWESDQTYGQVGSTAETTLPSDNLFLFCNSN